MRSRLLLNRADPLLIPPPCRGRKESAARFSLPLKGGGLGRGSWLVQRGALALSFLCFVVAAAPVRAEEDVAAFYKDKIIRMVVGSAAGSGYDIGARVVARYMRQFIPGNPTIIVQNQPGAASITMTSALYNSAPRDGTVIGAAINGMPTAPLLEPTAARFDPAKLYWLGSANREVQVTYVW